MESCRSPSPCCSRSGSVDVDPGVVITFFEDDIHFMLGLEAIAAAALPSPTSVAIPPVGATAAQSCIAFQRFLDNVALKVGMKNSNLVVDTNKQRLYGLFDGLPTHLADRFEAEISRYPWHLLPANRTVGKA